MTFFELSGCFFSICGAIAGGLAGRMHYGLLGALIGGPVGFLGGWGAGLVFVWMFIEDRKSEKSG